MKAKTVKRLAILIAVLSLVGGTAFSVQQFQVRRLGRTEIKKAELKAQEGEFSEAEKHFEGYLKIFPDDMEASIKRADALLKVSRSRVTEAIGIYESVLKRNPGRDDVRRSLMKAYIDMKRLVAPQLSEAGANVQLDRLFEHLPDDGEVLFFIGRSYQEGWATDVAMLEDESHKAKSHKAKMLEDKSRSDAKVPEDKLRFKYAVLAYRKAIELKLDVPQEIEASWNLARLLRYELDQPKEADQVMDSLVAAHPEAYDVYLARGLTILPSRVAIRHRNPSGWMSKET